MLQWLRKKNVMKRILWTIAAMIVPAFVLWGVSSAVSSGRTSQVIATLDGKKIKVADYADNLEAVRQFARLVYGTIDRSAISEDDLRSQAWDRTLLLTEARRRKLSVSDNEAIAYIQTIPQFHRQDGAFDLQVYRYLLRFTLGTSPAAFEKAVKQQILLMKLQQELTRDIVVDDSEVQRQFAKDHQPFRLAYCIIPIDPNVSTTSPTDEALQHHYESFAERFRAPEQRSVRFVRIEKPPAPLPSDLPPAELDEASAEEEAPASASIEDADAASDEPLDDEPVISEETLYQQELDALRRQAERLVDRMLVDPSQFADVAAQSGHTAQRADDVTAFGPIPGIGYEPAVTAAIFATELGDISDPVDTDHALYILQPTDSRPSHLPPLDRVRDRVVQDWQEAHRKRLAMDRAETLLQSILAEGPGGSSLQSRAESLGLAVLETEPVAPSGYIDGLGPASLFADVIQSLAVGDVADRVIETPAGFAIVQLLDRAAIDPDELAARRQEIEQRLLAERRQEYYHAWLTGLHERVQLSKHLTETPAEDDAFLEDDAS